MLAQRDAFVNARQARWIAIRQRPDERGIDECKDGDARAEADRQDQDGGYGEDRIPSQLTQGEAEVVQEEI